jgi:hypothetical protein
VCSDLNPGFFGFIIEANGATWTSRAGNEGNIIVGTGNSYDAIYQDLRKKVHATDPLTPLSVQGGAVTPTSYFLGFIFG